jgi:hypothetical protein
MTDKYNAFQPQTLDDAPQLELRIKSIKLYLLQDLLWDYAQTVLDQAAEMKISATKRASLAIKKLKIEYERRQYADLDGEHRKEVWNLTELFETINEANLKALRDELRKEIETNQLDAENAMLVKSVQIAMAVYDAMTLYCKEFDEYLLPYCQTTPHSTMCDECRILGELLPLYAGDCYDKFSQARKTAAQTLFTELKQIELYETQE